MVISIVKIKILIDNLLSWVRSDLVANRNDITKSWLYDTFNEVEIGDINFFEQLKQLIEKGDEDSRKIETRLMFDKSLSNLPAFHVHYPAEEGKSGDNTLNTGFQFLEEGDYFSKSYIGQYDIIVTAGNSIECVMLYEFMNALLIGAAETLATTFDKFEFSGKQLMTNQDIIPYLTYYRAIGISLQNKKVVRSLSQQTVYSDINFKGDFYNG
jgi:hypothetical protein